MRSLKNLLDLVDSAPGHQEIPKPPSGGFFIWGSAINWPSINGADMFNFSKLGVPIIQAPMAGSKRHLSFSSLRFMSSKQWVSMQLLVLEPIFF